MPVIAQQLYEQTLVLRSQMDDHAAFAELVRLHAPGLGAFVRRLAQGSPELAEDLTQEIWIAIFRGLPSLLDVSRFRGWAFRIARDRVYRSLRRRRIVVDAREDLDIGELPAKSEPEPAVAPEDLQRGLAALSVQHREVLTLRFFEAMDYEEIARVTRAAVGTVRSRLHYAKIALRTALENQLHENKPKSKP